MQGCEEHSKAELSPTLATYTLLPTTATRVQLLPPYKHTYILIGNRKKRNPVRYRVYMSIELREDGVSAGKIPPQATYIHIIIFSKPVVEYYVIV